MNDRIAEIRARLDALEMPAVEVGTQSWIDRCEAPWNADFFRAAPTDIAWLLERLEAQKAMADEYRFELDRLRERIAKGHIEAGRS
jgi:hypothetical protein